MELGAPSKRSTQAHAGSQVDFAKEKQSQINPGAFPPLQLPHCGHRRAMEITYLESFPSFLPFLPGSTKPSVHGTKKPQPPNFLLYPLRLVKLPRLKEQIIENIKHFPFPLALMTGSYQIKRDACRRGEWQRDGVSKKGEGGKCGRTEI